MATGVAQEQPSWSMPTERTAALGRLLPGCMRTYPEEVDAPQRRLDVGSRRGAWGALGRGEARLADVDRLGHVGLWGMGVPNGVPQAASARHEHKAERAEAGAFGGVGWGGRSTREREHRGMPAGRVEYGRQPARPSNPAHAHLIEQLPHGWAAGNVDPFCEARRHYRRPDLAVAAIAVAAARPLGWGLGGGQQHVMARMAPLRPGRGACEKQAEASAEEQPVHGCSTHGMCAKLWALVEKKQG